MSLHGPHDYITRSRMAESDAAEQAANLSSLHYHLLQPTAAGGHGFHPSDVGGDMEHEHDLHHQDFESAMTANAGRHTRPSASQWGGAPDLSEHDYSGLFHDRRT